MARAVAGLQGRPVVEALVQTSADAEPEVAEAGLETLCTIWRRDGVVGEDLLLKLDPQAQDRVRALGVRVAEPLVSSVHSPAKEQSWSTTCWYSCGYRT
ncbi:hypothetical protein BGK67_32700 [Streptomyces subrutilus]|uniref:Uncharacterized protein n=2 Tax=Streptomyces subrutilus TaxID=36818 RepID=A0A1E5NZW4_9ACTN|nr:hypothetical protein BGK67_32700 [Streptomyces subrutilus]